MINLAKKTAGDMAKTMKEISIAQFFEKNRHLLGYDNKYRSLMTVIKEAVDNSLDACEEAGVLPEILVDIRDLGDKKIKVIVEDNGPGISKEHIPKVFGKLLYGSKFHRLKQSRGQQGIGISAAVLYSQLTTNNPTRIWSKSEDGEEKVHHYTVMVDTVKNEPEIIETIEEKAPLKHRGTRIEMIMEAKYRSGDKSVDEYIKQTAIVNPYAEFTYKFPDGSKQGKRVYKKVVDELPRMPEEIKPHPHGIELGVLRRMMKETNSHSVKGFLRNDFSRVGTTSAKNILKSAKIDPKMRTDELSSAMVENLLKAMQTENLMNPPTDCLSPIGEELIIEGLKKELNPEFVTAVTRKPSVYRGNPFQIEVGIAFGGDVLSKEGSANIMRFANKVPLLYMGGACACTEAVKEVNWKPYKLKQVGQGMPQGPVTILVHIASAWVPFTSESKDAVASYPDILDEIRLALQQAGRKMKSYLAGKRRKEERKRRVNLFERYLPEIAGAVAKLTDGEENKILEELEGTLQSRNKELYDEIQENKENDGKESEGEKDGE